MSDKVRMLWNNSLLPLLSKYSNAEIAQLLQIMTTHLLHRLSKEDNPHLNTISDMGHTPDYDSDMEEK
jgi:DNA-binding phage protein